jgi:phage recombination protein Bet
MAIANSLQAQPQKQDTGVFEYIANGEKIKLSSTMVKKYLVSGNPDKVTNQEVMMFMTLCKYQHLNPFLREAYLIKYGNSPATIVTGKDTFTKRANKNPNYLGKQAGIIVINGEGEVINREGTFRLPNEEIVGGWAKIFIKDREPEYNTVSFNEYVGRKSDGSINNQWATKPATMIRKVAIVQALRECFPEDFSAMYSPEEMSNVNMEVDVNEIVGEDDKPIVIEDSSTTSAELQTEAVQEAPKTTQSAADALFG